METRKAPKTNKKQDIELDKIINIIESEQITIEETLPDDKQI